MVLRPDQERVKTLLKDTIGLLCKNGLEFQEEFSIDAVIGITLDRENLFYVSISDTYKAGDLEEEDSDDTDDDDQQNAENKPELDVTANIAAAVANKPPKKKRAKKAAQIKTVEFKPDQTHGTWIQPAPCDLSAATAGAVQGATFVPVDQQIRIVPGLMLPQPAQPGEQRFQETPNMTFDMNADATRNWPGGPIPQHVFRQRQAPLQPPPPPPPPPPAVAAVTTATVVPTQPVNNQPVTAPPVTKKSNCTTKFTSSSSDSGVSCTLCGKRFNSRSNLRRHHNAHLGIHPYMCYICQKGFTSKANVKGHMASVHHGQREFKCDICAKEFTRKVHLKTHAKVVHRITM